MAKFLYIESSPRKDRSASIGVAGTFLDAYRKSHHDDVVETIDLWKAKLPAFDGEVINAKYAILHGEKHSDAQRAAWKPVEAVIETFMTSDKFLISLPMWNFGIPYVLKHYIDILVQPGYTFSFSPEEGYKGLVTGKPAAVIYARGGAYGSGTGAEGYDYQKTYMEHILGFIGFTGIQSIVIEPTLMSTPEEKKKLVASANERARQMAAGF